MFKQISDTGIMLMLRFVSVFKREVIIKGGMLNMTDNLCYSVPSAGEHPAELKN